MTDILALAVLGLIVYIVSRIALKEPILFWKKSNKKKLNVKLKSNKKKKHEIKPDQEPSLFEELFKDVVSFDNHMIRKEDNTFILLAEVEPVNYFLKSEEEQEAIDIIFERWTAQIYYPVQIYLSTRYIDLSEPISHMKRNMDEAGDLVPEARAYGQTMIEELIKWQMSSPRYETKRYLSFSFQVKENSITADSNEEFEEKLVDKAFAELYRRFNAAKSQLRKSGVALELLTTEGIIDVFYHTFNRKKAVKNRFKDFSSQEMTALYVTADQSDEKIEALKEMIESEKDIITEKKEASG
ncbi:hypothetical protein [Bacillus swezeyi]|uniref:TraC-like domain-containing protein n=1 Tax=Bacillus swezeyi TaxID=1925020 RepID=A0A5M8RGM6_9BACI|nr:hypothetical protein [Bacillus swezeyi]KAA6446991.1 hypothetical protein DX927_23395 [Bacillus swezeyi]KAA6471559.1 hypothetical protein DX928_23635 [Bacillus swezeyi]